MWGGPKCTIYMKICNKKEREAQKTEMQVRTPWLAGLSDGVGGGGPSKLF